jgi:hypothetical protein
VLSNIDGFLTMLEEFGLVVTQRAAGFKLHDLRDRLEDLPEDASLDDNSNELRDVMTTLRTTLQAESMGMISFVTTDKRYDVDRLTDKIQVLMAPGVHAALPDIARHDFDEAGKCIAFERPTAAAFHLMRAVEDVLRAYYCAVVKRQRVDPLLWGPMVNQMRKRRQPPPEVLLANLDNLRLSFRNPTQHPEKIYDIEEVQDLFALSIDVVNRMARDLK